MHDRGEFSEAQEKNLKEWLFNPFHYLAGEKALGLGLVFIAALILGEILSKAALAYL